MLAMLDCRLASCWPGGGPDIAPGPLGCDPQGQLTPNSRVRISQRVVSRDIVGRRRTPVLFQLLILADFGRRGTRPDIGRLVAWHY